MIRLISEAKYQVQEPTLEENIKKFSHNFHQIIKKNEIIPSFTLLNQFEQFQLANAWKIITIWQQEGQLDQILCEYGYDYFTKTLEMSCKLSRNYRIAISHGTYYINLAAGLFLKYSKQISNNKQIFQFNINPLTGTIKITSKIFIKQEQLRLQISRQDHLQSTFYELCTMLGYYKKLAALQNYSNGLSSSCPVIDFSKHSSKNYDKNFLAPQILLYSINEALNEIDPNCQQNLDSVGSFESISEFILKNQVPMPRQLLQIIQILKGKQKTPKKQVQIPTIINKVCDIYDSDDSESGSQILLKKITFITDIKSIVWQKFAKGGFGMLEKAYCKYQLCDVNNRNKVVMQGQVVRKSDLKDSKIHHEKKIFYLLKNDQNSIIMPHYISDQFPQYIFSKFEPNMSLDKYLSVNRKALSLLSIVRILQNVAKGLLFLKQKGITHLDMKPNNLILTNNLKVKISDFGEAYYQQIEKPNRKICFTVPYVPSEVFSYPSKAYLNSKADVYSFGVTMFKILFNQHMWLPILDKSKFIQQLLVQQPQVLLSPQKLLRFGIPEIIGVLVNLSLKCILRSQAERPSLFYLSILLSLCRLYLLSLIQGSIQISQ